MKSVSLLLLVVAATMPGCRRGEMASVLRNSVEADGLVVSIELPKRSFTVGERSEVVVTATNTTGKAMTIFASSGAPVYLHIWRHTGLSWEKVKRYPRTATMVMTPWRIEGRGERRFVMPLTVEPDWPTGEILKISAELNGRPEASPQLTFQVTISALTPAAPQWLETLP